MISNSAYALVKFDMTGDKLPRAEHSQVGLDAAMVPSAPATASMPAPEFYYQPVSLLETLNRHQVQLNMLRWVSQPACTMLLTSLCPCRPRKPTSTTHTMEASCTTLPW